MERNQILEKLNDIFKETFDDEELVVNERTTSKDVEGWDSLMHIALLFSIESEWGIHFSVDDQDKMKNVGDIINMIVSKTS